MKGHQQDNENIKINLQKNTFNSLINVLEYIADKEAISNYNDCLSYVNVFIEIYEQWKSLYLIKQKWFLEIFTEEQLLQLNKFNKEFICFFDANDIEQSFDVVITSDEWVKISQIAVKTLLKIGNITDVLLSKK
ncbi:MAG: hypothetical protein IM568_13320 [Flavobacterium sp.]|jgi:hypothetical protein|nr:hypothetical protein [Flavobacterium sp.]